MASSAPGVGWWENKFHVVEDDGGSSGGDRQNITLGFSLLPEATPALIARATRAEQRANDSAANAAADAPREGPRVNLAELRLYCISREKYGHGLPYQD